MTRLQVRIMNNVLDFIRHKEKIDRENLLKDDSRLMPYYFSNKTDEDIQNDYNELHQEIELDRPRVK